MKADKFFDSEGNGYKSKKDIAHMLKTLWTNNAREETSAPFYSDPYCENLLFFAHVVHTKPVHGEIKCKVLFD